MSWLGLFLIASGVFILGATGGSRLAVSIYQEQAIQHACAQYDPKTGEFTWVTPTNQ